MKPDWRLTRFKMYTEIMEKLPMPLSGKILAISDVSGFSPMIDYSRSDILESSYPAVDFHNLPYADNSFDVIVSDQVLEHLANPAIALAEAHRVLKPGGIAIHTTCFMNYYHPAPIDYWRFSADALKHLHKDYSSIICCNGWGNRVAILLCMLGDRFRALQVPKRRLSLLNRIATFNDPRYPISTWIVARK